jgi:EmrB/QacA subfamily drug resistance transporter
MTLELPPDDADGVPAHVAGKERGRSHKGTAQPSLRPAAARPAEAPQPATPLDLAAIRTMIAGIMLALFLSALEQTIVAPALPAIGRSLGHIDDLPWVVTAYLLAATGTTPLFGKLSDIHGRRTILLLSIIIFVAGSVACALAPAMWVLVLGRALQGIGGGGLLPIVQTIIADLVSPRERPIVQSYVSVTFMSASILGPVLGGLLTDHLHWSFIFWLNLPLGAVALVMTARALRRLPRHERPHQLDLVGGALMIGAALALLLALTWGTRYGWTSWRVVGLLVGSAVLSILFVTRLLTAREPFIPVAILRGRVTSAITCASFFAIGTVIGVTIYTPLYCQVVLGASASASGLVLIGFMAGTTAGSLAAGRLIVGLTHYMRVPIAGLVIAVVVLAVLAAAPARFSLGAFALLLTVLGLTLGPMYTVGTVVMQNAVKRHQLGTATGTLNLFRVLGGAMVVAAFGAIIVGGAGDAVSTMILGKLAGGHGDFASAFRFVFIAAAVCLGAALACVLAVEERPLHGPVRLGRPEQ